MNSDFSKNLMKIIFCDKNIFKNPKNKETTNKKKTPQNLFSSGQKYAKTSTSQTSHEVSEIPTWTVPAHQL